jgi:hypothetical protein
VCSPSEPPFDLDRICVAVKAFIGKLPRPFALPALLLLVDMGALYELRVAIRVDLPLPLLGEDEDALFPRY